jgi:hypothetical protein
MESCEIALIFNEAIIVQKAFLIVKSGAEQSFAARDPHLLGRSNYF